MKVKKEWNLNICILHLIITFHKKKKNLLFALEYSSETRIIEFFIPELHNHYQRLRNPRADKHTTRILFHYPISPQTSIRHSTCASLFFPIFASPASFSPND